MYEGGSNEIKMLSGNSRAAHITVMQYMVMPQELVPYSHVSKRCYDHFTNWALLSKKSNETLFTDPFQNPDHINNKITIYTGDIEQYDTDIEEWTTLEVKFGNIPSMFGRSYITHGNNLYIMGEQGFSRGHFGQGNDPGPEPINNNMVFHIDSGEAEKITRFDKAKSRFTPHHEAGSTKAYIVHDNVLEFDILNQTFKVIGDLKLGREDWPGVVTTKNYIYVFGGGMNSSTVERLSLAGNEESEEIPSSMFDKYSFFRNDFVFIPLRNKIITFGYDTAYSMLTFDEESQTKLIDQKEIVEGCNKLSYQHRGVLIDDKLWLIGSECMVSVDLLTDEVTTTISNEDKAKWPTQFKEIRELGFKDSNVRINEVLRWENGDVKQALKSIWYFNWGLNTKLQKKYSAEVKTIRKMGFKDEIGNLVEALYNAEGDVEKALQSLDWGLNEVFVKKYATQKAKITEELDFNRNSAGTVIMTLEKYKGDVDKAILEFDWALNHYFLEKYQAQLKKFEHMGFWSQDQVLGQQMSTLFRFNGDVDKAFEEINWDNNDGLMEKCKASKEQFASEMAEITDMCNDDDITIFKTLYRTNGDFKKMIKKYFEDMERERLREEQEKKVYDAKVEKYKDQIKNVTEKHYDDIRELWSNLIDDEPKVLKCLIKHNGDVQKADEELLDWWNNVEVPRRKAKEEARKIQELADQVASCREWEPSLIDVETELIEQAIERQGCASWAVEDLTDYRGGTLGEYEDKVSLMIEKYPSFKDQEQRIIEALRKNCGDMLQAKKFLNGYPEEWAEILKMEPSLKNHKARVFHWLCVKHDQKSYQIERAIDSVKEELQEANQD